MIEDVPEAPKEFTVTEEWLFGFMDLMNRVRYQPLSTTKPDLKIRIQDHYANTRERLGSKGAAIDAFIRQETKSHNQKPDKDKVYPVTEKWLKDLFEDFASLHNVLPSPSDLLGDCRKYYYQIKGWLEEAKASGHKKYTNI